jgi:hypothetical protein
MVTKIPNITKNETTSEHLSLRYIVWVYSVQQLDIATGYTNELEKQDIAIGYTNELEKQIRNIISNNVL